MKSVISALEIGYVVSFKTSSMSQRGIFLSELLVVIVSKFGP